jgi:hypothetical protein
MFTKSAGAKINAELISSPKRCRSGRLWYGEPNAVADAIVYAQHRSRSYDAVIRVCDDAGYRTLIPGMPVGGRPIFDHSAASLKGSRQNPIGI